MGLEEIVESQQSDEKVVYREVKKTVKEFLQNGEAYEDEKLGKIIRSQICVVCKTYPLPISKRKKIEKRVFNDLRRLGVLQEYLDDDTVTEIMVNAFDQIYIEKNGEMHRVEKGFESEEEYEDIIQKIVGRRNKVVNESIPIVDTRLDNGERINIVLSPIALGGSVLTIRKFERNGFGLQDLVKRGAIDEKGADFLEELVRSRYNIFISGGTSSGKTTFLGALAGLISNSERVICIEDSAEIQFKNDMNLVRMESRDKNFEGRNEITIRDLVRTSLRMRPDRIIVGECRGEETFEMLQAMNTGHDGCFSTGHANSTKDMISRLESMSLMGENLPLDVIRNLISSGIEIIVHMERLRNGRRVVKEISEIEGLYEGEIKLQRLYVYDEGSDVWIWEKGLKSTLKSSNVIGNYG